MPAGRFFDLALRLFYYQGTMQYRLMEEQEQSQPKSAAAPTYGPPPSVPRPDGSRDEEVKVVPLAGLLAMMPGVGEYTVVKKEDQA